MPISWSGTRRSKKTISAKSQQSVIDYNVFEGIEVTGLPRFVLTRGHVSIQDGKVESEAGPRRVRRPRGRSAPVNRALSKWKEVVAPRKVERTGIPASGV